MQLFFFRHGLISYSVLEKIGILFADMLVATFDETITYLGF